MREILAAWSKTVCRGTLATAALLVAASALAATGVDVNCDGTADPADVDLSVEGLAIDVGNNSLPGGTGDDAPASSPIITASGTPLTELKASGLTENTTGFTQTDKADSLAADDETPSPNSRFPGVSEHEALRYRRHMYRTDI